MGNKKIYNKFVHVRKCLSKESWFHINETCSNDPKKCGDRIYPGGWFRMKYLSGWFDEQGVKILNPNSFNEGLIDKPADKIIDGIFSEISIDKKEPPV